MAYKDLTCIYDDIYLYTSKLMGNNYATTLKTCCCFMQKDANRMVCIGHQHNSGFIYCVEDCILINNYSVMCAACKKTFNISAKKLRFLAKMAVLNKG